MEESRTWNDFDEDYLLHDSYTLVLMAIVGKAGKVREEGNQSISEKGNCTKNEISEIDLNCLTIVPISKWEKILKERKNATWFSIQMAVRVKKKEWEEDGDCMKRRLREKQVWRN